MIYPNRQEQIALITGSARRIGAAIAQALHASGFKIAIHCHHSLIKAQALAQQCNQLRPDSARVFTADFRQEQAAEQLIAQISHWVPRLTVLVNNASLFSRDPQSWDLKLWQDLLTINVQTPYQLSKAAFPFLQEQQGVIINITDIHSLIPLKHYTLYCQTKAALYAQTKALALEFAPKVRVNAVAPGAIAWPEKANRLTTSQQEKIIQQTPLNKHGDPQYIAQAALALIENPFITGQVLHVDGGRSVR